MSLPTPFRRHVFFLSGFDPKGASYYHGLYRKEAALQGQVTGARYDVGPRRKLDNGNTIWMVRSTAPAASADGHAGQPPQATAETTFEYVRWDDIVREHWPRSGWQVLLGSLRGYRAALASPAALRKVWHASRKTLVALALPAGFWLAVALTALAVGALLGGVLTGIVPTLAAWVLGAAATVGIFWAALAWERRLNTSWLLRIYQFAADWRDGRAPAVDPRMNRLAADVLQRLQDPAVDEVLVIGFSVGSLLAVSAAARIQQQAEATGQPLDKLTLVTLGHCIPLLGLMRGADAFRAELARLGQPPRLEWVDFSSLTDWGSFALVEPLALCLGPGGADRPHAARMASPRFHLMFEPDEYQRIVRNKRRMHLQYLMAGRRPALYDYFAITAGPEPLPQRLSRSPAP